MNFVPTTSDDCRTSLHSHAKTREVAKLIYGSLLTENWRWQLSDSLRDGRLESNRRTCDQSSSGAGSIVCRWPYPILLWMTLLNS